MRKSFTPAALLACALLAGCGAPQPTVVSQNSNANSAANSAQTGNATTSIQHGPSTSNMGVASSHGVGDANSNAAPAPGTTVSTAPGAPPAPAVLGTSAGPPVKTPELDAKIQKAEAKARAAGSGDADKKAAAAAYFARADYYRDQGIPVLYKYALADYRCGLKYDPDAKEARQKMDEIVEIYQSMNRPVPEVGCAQ